MSDRNAISEVEAASELAAQLRVALSRLRRRLREQGTRADLTPSQVAVIHRLEERGADTVSNLARAEGIRPQSMSSIVAGLQEAGLVRGISDPSDGRKTLMSLSNKCVKWLREGRAARQDWLSTAILQKLSAQEQRKLTAALELLERLTDDGPLA